jgi:gamma-glutamyltranspeptidase/glutathione hydrolase
MVEPGFDPAVLVELPARGHRIAHEPRESTDFGAAQLIYCLDDVYLAASERRRDGQAVGF